MHEKARFIEVIPVWNGMDPIDAAYEQAIMGGVAGYRWWWPIARRLGLKKLEWAVVRRTNFIDYDYPAEDDDASS